jgi:methylated-DNA-[protein]-cysteine S-methyltransferase
VIVDDLGTNAHAADLAAPAIPPPAVPPPAIPPATVQPGALQPAAVQPGALQPAAVQPGAVQPAAVQPGALQLAAVQPGAVGVAALWACQLEACEGLLVRAAGYPADVDSLHARLPPRDRQRPLTRRDDLGPVTDALRRYHAGELVALDALAVVQAGTQHQQAIWEALREIPAGTTATYTELAARAGNERAVRAAGTACGRNLVAPIVPCHRAVRSNGGLGGYYYGLAVKRWLLDHEARTGTTTSDPSSPWTTRTDAL